MIGNELLDGRVADTNIQRLARALAEVGLSIAQRTTILDDIPTIVTTARAIIARGTDLCVVSGGLGPTSDDLTSEAFAALAGVELVRDAPWLAHLEARFVERGFVLTDNQRKQADRPAGAEAIANPRGTALGFAIEVGGCRFVSVPGVPGEFEALVELAVLEPLREGAAPLDHHELRTFGLIEGVVDQRLAPVATRWPAVGVGFRARFPEIHVTLRAEREHRTALGEALTFAREALAPHVFTEEGRSLPEILLAALRERGATLATAESCTGGLIGDLLTDVPGSSDVYQGGIVAYSNDIKRAQLGVDEATLEEHGAVSEAAVVAMAAGARERLGATHAIAVSGIAGPGGGAPDKPVGTVWIAAAGPGVDVRRHLSLPFDRRRNKVVSAYAALELLRTAL